MSIYSEIIEKISPFLTTERKLKIDRVLAERMFDKRVLLENIYDRGNIAAVMRSAEAFGIFQCELVDTRGDSKISSRVTQGADRWLEICDSADLAASVRKLKSAGFLIAASELGAPQKLAGIDFSKPIAFAFGNEKEGVSSDLLEMADIRFEIPMFGFTQSFNISVAAALCFQELRRLSPPSAKDAKALERLQALYYLRSYEHSERLFSAQTIESL